jgi:hypothetical protein
MFTPSIILLMINAVAAVRSHILGFAGFRIADRRSLSFDGVGYACSRDHRCRPSSTRGYDPNAAWQTEVLYDYSPRRNISLG